MPLAWALRNSVQLGPSRRGAGRRPCRERTLRTLVVETVMPSFLSSPTIRRYPQRGETNDEIDGLGHQRWPTRLAVRIGPTPPDESSVPVEDRCRRDDERRPAFARNEDQRSRGT